MEINIILEKQDAEEEKKQTMESTVRILNLLESQGYTFYKSVSILESLPYKCQILLKKFLLEFLNRNTAFVEMMESDELNALTNAGFLRIVRERRRAAAGAENDAGVASVSITPKFENSCRKTYTYLVRKYDNDYSFASGDHFPKESVFTELGYKFPNDEITALLDKYDANRCRLVMD